jgi:hypothetical protein
MSSLFTINEVKLIGSITYISTNADCTICHENIDNDSIYAQDKGIRSTHCTGLCGHTFHHECITSWLQSNTNCPICIKKFK